MSTLPPPPAPNPPPPPFPPSPARGLSRRALLAGLLGTGTAAVAGLGVHQAFRADGQLPGLLPARADALTRSVMGDLTGARALQAVADPDLSRRVLVLIELSGGNDGMATLAPMADPLYRRLRPNLGFTDEEVVWLDDAYGVHPALAGLQTTGVAWVQGVGTREPSLSHFEMENRWWAGDSRGDTREATGFLGRLCDELDVGAPVTGVSLGGGSTPALASAKAVTLGLSDPGGAWYLTNEDPWFRNLRDGMGGLAVGAPDGSLHAAAARGLTDALAFGAVLGSIGEETDEGYPGTDLGRQLSLAARLIAADVGIRVLHVPTGGYDTHDDQRSMHDSLMGDLGGALTAFLQDLDRRGALGRTLVATTSEFGRRPAENGTGTDHGTASVAMVCGPVHAGRHGEYPSLSSLDENDDLVATVTMDDYYATLADRWFGVGPELVLPQPATPLDGIVRA